MTEAISRRQFLQGAGASVLTVFIPAPFANANSNRKPSKVGNAYLQIHADNRVIAVLPTSEMGQGTHTGQLMILGEELGIAPKDITVDMPLRPEEPYRLFFGQMRSVGSYGIRAWHDPLRQAAAQARSVLQQAAGEILRVPVRELTSENGHVIHKPSGNKIAFGELVALAAQLPLPDEPSLLPEAERKITGKPYPRVDTAKKLNGTALFGTDVDVPNMLHGAVRMSPVYGAAVKRINRQSIAGRAGVVDVAEVPGGAVVVAQSWWQAKQAADALEIEFEQTAYDDLSSEKLSAAMREGLAGELPPVVRSGDLKAGFADSSTEFEAIYEVPFLAHACMEPIVCTAHEHEQGVELWMPTQGHDIVRMAVEKVSNIPNERMTLHTTYLGGGFGRKTHGEIAEQAILASRAVKRPVKVMWAREDDIQQGYYRPIMMVRMRAGLDARGRITAFHAQLSGPQMGRTFEHVTVKDNRDFFSVAVLADQPYAENFALDHRHMDVPMPLSPWRAVSSSQNGFFLEAFVDELAEQAETDPLTFRRNNLRGKNRHLAVLDRVAKMSRWKKKAPRGIHRGLAVVESYGSVIAQVVELRMEQQRPKVERVHVAIDCGRAINPDSVEAQMEGSVAEALAAALRHEVPIQNGRAQRNNFYDYSLLRIDEMPEINVEIVDTGAPLGGVGEPGLPPLAPALANAVFAATGKRVRKLPILRDGAFA